MTDNQIVKNLEKQGYSNVKVTSHGTTRDQVMASKDGQSQKLTVDPKTGQVISD